MVQIQLPIFSITLGSLITVVFLSNLSDSHVLQQKQVQYSSLSSTNFNSPPASLIIGNDDKLLRQKRSVFSVPSKQGECPEGTRRTENGDCISEAPDIKNSNKFLIDSLRNFYKVSSTTTRRPRRRRTTTTTTTPDPVELVSETTSKSVYGNRIYTSSLSWHILLLALLLFVLVAIVIISILLPHCQSYSKVSSKQQLFDEKQQIIL